jgi:hypothetical protein
MVEPSIMKTQLVFIRKSTLEVMVLFVMESMFSMQQLKIKLTSEPFNLGKVIYDLC